MQSNSLQFGADGKFKIVQFADIQETYVVNPDTLDFMRAVLDREKPDLVVLSGDQIKGYGLYFLTGNKEQKFRATLNKILAPMVERNIPIAAVFGNHDEAEGASKPFQWGIYKQNGQIGENVEGLPGYGNYCLEIKNRSADGKAFLLWFFDSSSRAFDTQLKYVTQQQLNWYRSQRDAIEQEKGYLPKSLVFQHIPLLEVYELLKETKKGQKGSYESFTGEYKNRFFTLSDDIEEGGFMGENVAAPAFNSGEFDVLAEKGDVIGIFFGHDHNNSFVGTHRGIRMGYTQGCGFNCYGPGLDRGARVFILDEKNTDSFYTSTVTYKSFPEKKLKRPVKEYLYRISPSSVNVLKKSLKKYFAITAVTATAAAASFALIKNFSKRGD